MLREMTSAQLDEWIAFYRIEPWGLAVIDSLIASLKALLININTPRGKPKIKKLDGLLLWPEKGKRIDAQLHPDDDF
jgi:hypothetical protein